jgi:hypothetical protein
VSASGWEQVGSVAPGALLEGRLELHYAAQLAAAVGASLIDARADDSHPNLGWDGRSRALVGHLVPGQRRFAAALSPEELTLRLVDEAGVVLAELGLVGRSLEAGRAWLDEETRSLGATARDGSIRLPGYALPDHPLATGACFSGEQAAAVAELGHWYAGAHALLADLATRDAEASSVRVWPHHLDMATLVTLSRDASGDAARTVGIGLSPGDGSYAEPYWYVSPWPYPLEATLPSLGGAGHWHMTGFTAAILEGHAVVSAGGGREQAERIRDFLGTAVAACRHLLTE